MYTVTIKTYWHDNVEPSSISHATKETLDEAWLFKDEQCCHYQQQGFRVWWAIAPYFDATIAQGEE